MRNLGRILRQADYRCLAFRDRRLEILIRQDPHVRVRVIPIAPIPRSALPHGITLVAGLTLSPLEN
jgi:hypothetical protein